MKQTIRNLLVFAVCVCLLIPVYTPAFAEPGDAIELGTYGNEALTFFSVDPNNVIYVSQTGDSDEIKRCLKTAEDSAAETGETFMVYVPAGTHPIYAQLKVQPGVILCGETDTIFDSQLPEDSPAAILVWVYGSVYGGTYNCNKTCDTVLRFGDCAYTMPNGYVMYTNVNDAKLRGITASGENASGFYILYNTVTNVGKDCIGVSYGAVAEGIVGNVLSIAEQSGIDIIHTDVIDITGNTISDVVGHGISTDTEQPGKDHAYCRITNVTDNIISNCEHHGVYLEKDCKITGNMSGNVITNCTLNGVCLGENATIGSSANEKYFFNNIVQESGRSNISVGTTGSALFMGADNQIINGKNAGIAVGEGARLYIIGENNAISDNTMNGIQIASGGWVKTFAKTYINNNRWGVNMNEGGSALLNYCVIEGNSLGSVYYVYGSTYRQTDCTMGGRVYVAVGTGQSAEQAEPVELGTYGKKALSYFSIDPNNVIYVSANGDSNEIKQCLSVAEKSAASARKPFMVYVPAGTHPIDTQLKVQPGVILCGEKKTIFDSRLPANSPATILVWVYGSVYGGTFNCHNTCKSTVLRLGECAFTKPNGFVMYTTVNDAYFRGITASGSKTSGFYISYNTVKNVGKDCIGICNGATAKGVIGNTLSVAKQSGIDIVHANVVNISKNTISNVTGHGISTDTEQTGRTQNYCRITNVLDNKITGAGAHGVYLEANCKITGNMSGNVISNCKNNGVNLGKNATIGSSSNKKYFYNNTIQNSGKSQISISNSGAALYMGANNKITKGQAAGISIGNGGRLYVLGKNNYITYNKLNGIQIAKGGWMKTYVKYTYINNNRWGVNMNAGGTALLNYCVIKGNSLGSVYYVKGSTYRRNTCIMGGKVYCKK